MITIKHDTNNQKLTISQREKPSSPPKIVSDSTMLTFNEATTYTGLSRHLLNKATKTGGLSTVSFGRQRRICKGTLDKWLRQPPSNTTISPSNTTIIPYDKMIDVMDETITAMEKVRALEHQVDALEEAIRTIDEYRTIDAMSALLHQVLQYC